MTDDLSTNEETVLTLMPATSHDLKDAMGIGASYVYDLVESLRRKGVNVEQHSDGRYYVPDRHDVSEPVSTVRNERQTSSTKASMTRKANEFLTELESEVNQQLRNMEPAVADGGLVYNDGNHDFIDHHTDAHFGELNENQHGDVIFDSEIAEERTQQRFDEARGVVESRRDSGIDFDTANLLLGGDIITGESIYEGQPHEIDEKLQDQISRAVNVYVEGIRSYSDMFPSVQVVCQAGNHGRLGSGNPTNADSILYSILDRVVRESTMENVTFIQSDRSYYTDFQIRDWNAHLRHGHDSSLEHIGTSAAKARWRSWLIDHQFDIAFRGHYHGLKEEPINGRPVVMGGSILPQTEFEESNAMSGRAMGAVHAASDEYPLEWTERIHFG